MYDYLDYIEQRAFSEGYCSRMIEEQREYGVQSLINGFKNARSKGHGLLDSANIARNRAKLAKDLKSEGHHFNNLNSAKKNYAKASERVNDAFEHNYNSKVLQKINDRINSRASNYGEELALGNKYGAIRDRAYKSRENIRKDALDKLNKEYKEYYDVKNRISKLRVR